MACFTYVVAHLLQLPLSLPLPPPIPLLILDLFVVLDLGDPEGPRDDVDVLELLGQVATVDLQAVPEVAIVVKILRRRKHVERHSS